MSGPSGVGKSSILSHVIAETNSEFSVSATTRDPRPGEVEGRDYVYLSRPEFEDRIASESVLEWAEYGGNLYGTLREQVLPALDAGRNIILDIENEGAKQIKASFPEAVLIFIRPPSLSVLEDRLRGRGDTHEADIQRRLSVADQQMREAPLVYHHIVLNDDMESAIDRFLDILTARTTDRVSA